MKNKIIDKLIEECKESMRFCIKHTERLEGEIEGLKQACERERLRFKEYEEMLVVLNEMKTNM